MVEERVTEVRTPAGDTHTHTEVIHDSAPRRSGMGWVIVVILVVALVVGAFILMQGTNAEVAKDNAVAGAAESVGSAAESVGNAADSAADRIAE